MRPAEILVVMRTFGLHVSAEGETIVVRPKGATPPDLAETIRAHKREILGLIRAEQHRAQALGVLIRLKTYSLPAGRMPAAREIAERCASGLIRWRHGGPSEDVDPSSILRVLLCIESDLIALGGAPDPKLTEASVTVERAFPGARLIEVRRKDTVQQLPASRQTKPYNGRFTATAWHSLDVSA